MPQEVAFPSENGLARGFLNSTRTSARNVSLYSLLSSFSSSPFPSPQRLRFVRYLFSTVHPSFSPFPGFSICLSVCLSVSLLLSVIHMEEPRKGKKYCVLAYTVMHLFVALSYILSALGKDTHLFSSTESIKFDTWLSPSSRVCCLRYYVHSGYCSSILKYFHCLPKLLTTTQREFFDGNFVNFEVSIPLLIYSSWSPLAWNHFLIIHDAFYDVVPSTFRVTRIPSSIISFEWVKRSVYRFLR